MTSLNVGEVESDGGITLRRGAVGRGVNAAGRGVVVRITTRVRASCL